VGSLQVWAPAISRALTSLMPILDASETVVPLLPFSLREGK